MRYAVTIFGREVNLQSVLVEASSPQEARTSVYNMFVSPFKPKLDKCGIVFWKTQAL